MSLCVVDRHACVRCGTCSKVCPMMVIDPDKENYPRVRAMKEGLCIGCGHCVAACPKGALTMGAITPASCEAIPPLPSLTPEQAGRFFKSRRSIRQYQEKPVPRETLTRLLDIVRYAPTGKNNQPCHWLVIDSPQELHRLAELTVDWIRETKAFPGADLAWDKGEDMVLRKAPCLVVAHAPATAMMPLIDCTIALSHLELAATAFGLGGCWAGIINFAADRSAPVASQLRLPAGHKSFGMMMLGYPKYAYARAPKRLEARVEWR